MGNIKRIGTIFLVLLLAATMLLTSCEEAVVPGADDTTAGDTTTIETTTLDLTDDTTTVSDTTTAASTTTADITQSETVVPNDSAEVTPSDGTTTAVPNDTTVEVTPSTTTTVAPTDDTTTVVTPSDETTTYVPNDTTTAAPSDDTTTVPSTTTQRPATTTAATTTQKPVTTTEPVTTTTKPVTTAAPVTTTVPVTTTQPTPDPEPKTPGVKIITWNVCGYNNNKEDTYGRVDMVAATIKKTPADIYCLQEVGKILDVNTVKTKIMAGYTIVAASEGKPSGASSYEDDYFYNHIYYNSDVLTLVDSGSKMLMKKGDKVNIIFGDASNLDRFVTWAVFEHKETKKQFIVFNAHLDTKSATVRTKQVEKLYSYIDSSLSKYKTLPMILCGDMNADYQTGKNSDGSYYHPTESTFNKLNDGTHFKWAYQFDGVKLVTDNKPEFEWYSDEPYTYIQSAYVKDIEDNGRPESQLTGGMDKKILDFIFVSPNTVLTPKTYQVVYCNVSTRNGYWRYASDHMPIACELEFN